MSAESRFRCPSGWLVLRSLLSRTQKVLWVGFGLAMVLHAFLAQVRGPAQENRTAKPLTTQFVKRRPRLTKPLELKKRPAPRRRMMRRTMVSVKAGADRQGIASASQVAESVGSLARPGVTVARGAVSAGMETEPQAVAAAIEGTKEQENKVDLALEMVDVRALDTGKYKAIVIQDPTDRRMIKGFLHLGLVYLKSMLTIHVDRAQMNVLEYIRRVVDAMNTYTDIETDLKGRYTFDSAEMLEIPWIFLNTNREVFQVGHAEATNMGRYLTTGGFLYVETACPHPWDRPGSPDGMWRRQELVSGKNMLKDALATAGYRHGLDWTFEKIPSNHPVYQCYFDFEGPLPTYWPDYVAPEEAMYGITISGRLLMIFETGDYERFINDMAGDGSRYRQFLVNVVVFALTQEGSLTHRLMNIVNY